MTSAQPAPPLEDSLAFFGWWSELVEWTATRLYVPVSPIKLKVCKREVRKACTAQAVQPLIPTIYLSVDCLKAHIAAHEITHALIPTSSLFLAEGLASWIGCLVTGDCRHLLFPHATIDALLSVHQDHLPSLRSFLFQRLGDEGLLSPDQYGSLEGRLARAICASFAEFCVLRFHHFPTEVARQWNADPVTLVEIVASLSFNNVLDDWWKKINLEIPL